MENEIMNNEVAFDELDEVGFDDCEEPEEGINGKNILIGVAVAAVATGGIALLAYKLRPKVDAWMAKRLEKRGYVVTAPEVDECVDGVYFEESDSN